MPHTDVPLPAAGNTARGAHTARTIMVAFICDVALVLIFAGIGRSSHSRAAGALGLLETAWPFLAGLAATWLATLAFKRPLAVLRTGIPLWLGTVAIGMALRAVTGSGTALAFVIVATISLAVLLIGWRLTTAAVMRLRRRAQ